MNSYKYPDSGRCLLSGYFNHRDPTQGEKFFGSSTFLVWTTDFWHCAKTIMLACFAVAIVVYNPVIHPIVDALGYWLTFGAVFELFWSKIFLKKK